jgi:hypothetical protein
MNKINYKINLKPILIVIVSLLILLSICGVFVVTKMLRDTQNTVEIYIRNSNGKYWAATGKNIQVAIDDLGSLAPEYNGYGGIHGTVWLTGNTILTISSTIVVKDYVTIDMGGCEIKPDDDFDVFLLHKGAQLRNGIVNVSELANYNSAAIGLYALDGIGIGQHPVIVENISLVSSSQRGKAIYINTSGSETQHIAFLQCNNIQIEKFEYGIFIDHNTSGGDNYLNGNMFTNIDILDTKYCIKVYEAKSEAAGNSFENINCYCTNITEYIIWNNGAYNQYDNIQAFDWDNNSRTRTAYNFSGPGYADDWSGSAHSCYLCFRGGGNDTSFPEWNQRYNAYTILNLENNSLIVKGVRSTIYEN